ncbi:MAG: UMP kinase [Oscillospiraceae bacterium]|jgi:uridylate kinase|nr:UMP kinase [Oscillospiraceae bacterium]
MSAGGYKRILLKLSGEYLADGTGDNVDFEIVRTLALEVKKCQKLGVQLGVVVGGGNFWRGRNVWQMEKARADYVGMLATAMNATILYDVFLKEGVDTRLQMVIAMPDIAECYVRDRAVKHLDQGRVIIFGGGTGSPYFSTDTAAALKAIDIKADVIFKATHSVDGVYDKDPVKNENAVKYDTLSCDEIFRKRLEVMDMSAVALCAEHNIPVCVFSIKNPENLIKAIFKQKIGTMIVCA